MTPEERLKRAANYLDNWGQAIRNSWAELDGRTAKWQLQSLAEYMLSDKEDYDPFADVICLYGGSAHWFGSAFDHDCDELAYTEDNPLKEK